MEMPRQGVRAAGIVASVAAMWLSFADNVMAQSIDALGGNWGQANLKAVLDPAGSLQVEQGANFQLRVAADEEASVLVVVVNADSQARIMAPNRQATQDRIEPGSEMLIPDVGSGETLYADMPVGKATVYVIGSSDPLLQGQKIDASKWLPLADVEKQLRAAVAAHPGINVAVSRVALRVESPAVKDFVSSEEFVQFFGVGTRSVKNVDRGFAVQFEHDSADLTAWGRRQLDAVGHGMIDQRLLSDHFLVEGHTDDVGTDAYNLGLSQRRAASVAHYLGSLGVTPARLKETGLGKAGQAIEGTSKQARDANRRVVIRRLDGGS